MFRRMVAFTAMVLGASVMVGLPAPARADNPAAVAFPVGRTISTVQPDLKVQVAPDGAGDYSIAWEVRRDGIPVAGVSGTETGVVHVGTTEPFDVPGAGL